MTPGTRSSGEGDDSVPGPSLDDVVYRRGSFTLHCDRWRTPPGLTTVVGLNGAGKSTLLGLLAGHWSPHGGTARGTGDFVLLPQGANLESSARVRDLFRYIAGLRGVRRSSRRDVVQAALGAAGLTAQADVRLKDLSGGWRQRALIGQCLLGHHRGLLLDEPTLSLDVRAARDCWTMLRELSSSLPVVVATHEASASVEFSDQVVAIEGGHVAPPRRGQVLRQHLAAHGGSPESFLLDLIAIEAPAS